MGVSRREFGLATAATLALGATGASAAAATPPWNRRARRWCQINLTEDNPANFDLPFWRGFWKETRTQGVILNAGGDVAFYPTAVPGQRRAELLGERDFFGELATACRADGMAVIARLSLRGPADVLEAHPEWRNIDAAGAPLGTACMNGGYFYEYGAAVEREVATRYRPDGFTASGWGANYSLCYCEVCTRLYKARTGLALPRQKDWKDPVYRTWIAWNADQVMALWDHNNLVAKTAAGPQCLWSGQIVGSMTARGVKAVADRSDFIMVDHQLRDEGGYQDASTAAKVYNGAVGWRKPVVSATATFRPRLTTETADGWQLWMEQGIAGGAIPWWHTVSGYSQDKRRFAALPAIMQWHEKNEAYLFDRTPVATVGVVWSDTNNVFFGRETVAERVRTPWLGITQALIRARIPFVTVYADQIDRDAASLRTLVLPALAAMTDAQAASIGRFVAGGGGLLATGESSLYDAFGERRADYALADLYRAHAAPPDHPAAPPRPSFSEADVLKAMTASVEASGIEVSMSTMRAISINQTYLRLTPELRRGAFGPHNDAEPAVAPGAARHPVLKGLDATDIVFFGGTLAPLTLDPGAETPLTYFPPVPSNPPESAYLRGPATDIPGLVVNVQANGARIAFMPAELDRLYAVNHMADHADLLANAARWTARDDLPLAVDGAGLFDCSLYQQPGRMILHVANLSSADAPGQLTDLPAVGPVTVRVRLNRDVAGASARLLVADRAAAVTARDGWAEVQLPSIRAHEVLVLS